MKKICTLISVLCAVVTLGSPETAGSKDVLAPEPLVIETETKEATGTVTVYDADQTVRAQYTGNINIRNNRNGKEVTVDITLQEEIDDE